MVQVKVNVSDLSKMVVELAMAKGREIAASKIMAQTAQEARNKLYYCDRAQELADDFRMLCERVYNGAENCINGPLEIMDKSEQEALLKVRVTM